MPDISEDVEKLNPSYLACKRLTRYHHLENILAIPQPVKLRIIIQPKNSTSMYMFRELKTFVHTRL